MHAGAFASANTAQPIVAGATIRLAPATAFPPTNAGSAPVPTTKGAGLSLNISSRASSSGWLLLACLSRYSVLAPLMMLLADPSMLKVTSIPEPGVSFSEGTEMGPRRRIERTQTGMPKTGAAEDDDERTT